MLCLEVSCEHSPFIEVSCIDSESHISTQSDCVTIEVNSDVCALIQIDSDLVIGIVTWSDCDDLIETDSQSDLINVYSELSKDIFVWSDCESLSDVDSDCVTIEIDSSANGTIEVESHCALDKMGLQSLLDEISDVYSSYVCMVNTKGYLIIQGAGGKTNPPDEIIIFISDKFVTSINVQSDLRWIIK